MAMENYKNRVSKKKNKAIARREETQPGVPSEAEECSRADGATEGEVVCRNEHYEEIFDNILKFLREDLDANRITHPTTLRSVLMHTDKIMNLLRENLLKTFPSENILNDYRIYRFHYKSTDFKFNRGPSPYFTMEKMKSFGRLEFVANCWIFAVILLLPRILHYLNSKHYLLAEHVCLCVLKLTQAAILVLPLCGEALWLYLLTVCGWAVRSSYRGHISGPQTDSHRNYEDERILKLEQQCDELLAYDTNVHSRGFFKNDTYMDMVEKILYMHLRSSCSSKPMHDYPLLCELSGLHSAQLKHFTRLIQDGGEDALHSSIPSILRMSNNAHCVFAWNHTLRDPKQLTFLLWDWAKFWFSLSFIAESIPDTTDCLSQSAYSMQGYLRLGKEIWDGDDATEICKGLNADINSVNNFFLFYTFVLQTKNHIWDFDSLLVYLLDLVEKIEVPHCRENARGTYCALILLAADYTRTSIRRRKLNPLDVERIRHCCHSVLMSFLARQSNFRHSVDLFLDHFQYFEAKFQYQKNTKNISVARPALLFLLFPYPMFRCEQEFRKKESSLQSSSLSSIKTELEYFMSLMKNIGEFSMKRVTSGGEYAPPLSERSKTKILLSQLMRCQIAFIPEPSEQSYLNTRISFDELRRVSDIKSLRAMDQVNLIPIRHEASVSSLNQKLVLWCKNIAKCIFLMLDDTEMKGLYTREELSFSHLVLSNEESLRSLSEELVLLEERTDGLLDEIVRVIEEVAALLCLDQVLVNLNLMVARDELISPKNSNQLVRI